MTNRGTWLWAVAWLACACTGPGLEPPEGGDSNSSAGASGVGSGGIGGSAGVGGAVDNPAGAGGTGNSGNGGTSGPPAVEPMAGGSPDDDRDASVDEELGADGGAVVHDSEDLLGPAYMGSVSNSAECSKSYPTRGHQPVGPSSQRHPLFLYFIGTQFVAGDASAQHDAPAPLAVTEAMARRGFVALSVQYDNDAIAWLSDHQNQLACLFDGARAESLIAKACALPNVDCELGIATWGHSQGAYVAHAAHNREPRVRAVWTTGYGGDGNSTLPMDRLRVVNGEADALDNGTAAKLTMITGLTAEQCTDPDQCLREDGSGWIIVRKSELAMPDTSSADHCWFDRPSCGAGMTALEPNWIDPASDKAFALEANADWVAGTTRR